MADASRELRAKFTGDTSDLAAASRRGKRLIDNFGDSSNRSMRRSLGDSQRTIGNFADGSSGIMAGAMKIVSANAILMGAAVVGALAAAPAAAALAASGIVLGFGGALAAVGIIAAAQNKKVKREFTDLKKHVVGQLKEISVPFRSTLMTVAEVARDTFDSFVPSLRGAFSRMAPLLSAFTRQFGRAFRQLIPAIEPLTQAFGAILRQIGPQLTPLFRDIARELTGLADVVKDNRREFGAFIGFLLRLIPRAIQLVGFLARAFGSFIRNAPRWAAQFLRGWVRPMLKGMRFVADISLESFRNILRGAQIGLGWIPKVGPKIDGAVNAFEGFRRGVDRTLSGAIRKTRDWETALRRMPKEVRIRGDIRNLVSRLQAARQRLRNAPKEKRIHIRGDIENLRNRIADARARLATLQDKTVTIHAAFTGFSGATPAQLAALRGRQHGGPVQANRPFIVGEAGPELFIPRNSGEVVANDQLGGDTIVKVFIGERELTPMMVEVVNETNRHTRRAAAAGRSVVAG